jgi:hypothetical protein
MSDAIVPLSLEERKFRSDRITRIVELRLKRREIEAKEREVAAKEIELNRSRWTNPMVIALLAAAAGLAGNIIVARVNNSNTQQVERFHAQSNLIIEAIKTGDTEAACKNLVFFAGLNLIDDANNVIAKRCQKAPVGPPSLPLSSSLGSAYTSNNLGLFLGTGNIEGKVIDRDTKKGISGVMVTFHLGMGDAITPVLSIFTSSDGEFSAGPFTNRDSANTVRVTVKTNGYVPKELELSRTPQHLSIELQKLQ